MAEIKTVVVGLGNPILGDDGVGIRVAEEVQRQLTHPGVTVDQLAVGGIELMEHLIGYQRAIIVDVINTGKKPRGAVSTFPLEALENPFAGHLGSAHETNLQTALTMGRLLGAVLPDEVVIVAIESPYVYDFTEELSPPVAAAVPQAVQLVLEQLEMNPVGPMASFPMHRERWHRE